MRQFFLAFLLLLACASAAPLGSGQPPSAEKTYLRAVKKQLGERWTGLVLARSGVVDRTGCRYSQRDRRTAVEFTLRADGTVGEVTITGPSEVPYLDEIALQTVRDASPLPRPPAELLKGLDQIQLPFAFTLATSHPRCPEGSSQPGLQ